MFESFDDPRIPKAEDIIRNHARAIERMTTAKEVHTIIPHCTIAFADMKTRSVLIKSMDMVIDEHRQQNFRAHGRRMADTGEIPICAVLTTEIWLRLAKLTPGGPSPLDLSQLPSQCPDRKEAVSISALRSDGKCWMLIQPIGRRPNNTIEPMCFSTKLDECDKAQVFILQNLFVGCKERLYEITGSSEWNETTFAKLDSHVNK